MSCCPKHEMVSAEEEHFCSHTPNSPIVDRHRVRADKSLHEFKSKGRHLLEGGGPVRAN